MGTASAIFDALYADGTCPSTVTNGITTRLPCREAYGYLLGTSALCSLTLMGMAFITPAKLKRIFPPLVSGCISLVRLALISIKVTGGVIGMHTMRSMLES